VPKPRRKRADKPGLARTKATRQRSRTESLVDEQQQETSRLEVPNKSQGSVHETGGSKGAAKEEMAPKGDSTVINIPSTHSSQNPDRKEP